MAESAKTRYITNMSGYEAFTRAEPPGGDSAPKGNYPRKRLRLYNTYVNYIDLSCPEAVSQIIFNKNKIKLEPKTVHKRSSAECDKIEETFEIIRDFYLDVMNKENAEFWKKIAVMSLATRKISKAVSEQGCYAYIDGITAPYLVNMDDDSLFNDLGKVKYKSVESRYETYAAIWYYLKNISIKNSCQRAENEHLSSILKNMERGCNSDEWMSKLVNSIFTFEAPYMKEHEHITENLFSYLLITQLFNDNHAKTGYSVQFRFCKVITMLLMIQLFIASVFAEIGKCDDSGLNHIIAVWFKDLQNRKKYNSLLCLMEEMGEMTVTEIVIAFLYE